MSQWGELPSSLTLSPVVAPYLLQACLVAWVQEDTVLLHAMHKLLP
jgi:hypothetical protein